MPDDVDAASRYLVSVLPPMTTGQVEALNARLRDLYARGVAWGRQMWRSSEDGPEAPLGG